MTRLIDWLKGCLFGRYPRCGSSKLRNVEGWNKHEVGQRMVCLACKATWKKGY